MDQFSNHPLYRKHDLDSVMSSLLAFYRKHFLPLFLTVFVANLGMQFLSSRIDFAGIMGITDPLEMLAKIKTWVWPMMGSMVINLLFAVILQYYVIYNPVDSDASIFASLYKSLKYIPGFIVIMILFMFFASAAMIAGLIILFVGVLFSILYIFMIGLFFLPTLMAEGNNIGNSIVRSFTLSHRHFGSNLGWTAIILLIIIVGSIILSSIVLIPFSGSFFKILSNPSGAAEALTFMSNPLYIILSALASSLFTPLQAILGAIVYFNARARENEAVLPSAGNGEPDKVKVEDLYAKPWSDDHPENPANKY